MACLSRASLIFTSLLFSFPFPPSFLSLSFSRRSTHIPTHDGEPGDVRVVLPCRRRGVGLFGAPRVREVRLFFSFPASTILFSFFALRLSSSFSWPRRGPLLLAEFGLCQSRISLSHVLHPLQHLELREKARKGPPPRRIVAKSSKRERLCVAFFLSFFLTTYAFFQLPTPSL